MARFSWRGALKTFLFVPAVGLGAIGFQAMDRGERPVASAPEPAPLAVRIETLRPGTLRPAATGYGRLEAAREWTAVAQVTGRVAEAADGLAAGRIVAAGETLFEIDRRSYEIARDKALANVASAEAALAEIAQNETNTRALVAIEERALAVRQGEYERAQALVRRGTSPDSTLDAAEQARLAQEKALRTLRNTLELFDEQRASARAALAVRRAELDDAERALADTAVVAPFTGRVTAVEAEADEYVRVGEGLLTIEGTEASEVVAEFQAADLAPVLQASLGPLVSRGEVLDLTDATDLLREAGLTATVRREGLGGASQLSPATIERVRGSVDDGIGTIGIVVRVSEPNRARPGGRAPLQNGAFVAVSLEAASDGSLLFVPRDAVRTADDGSRFVYLADAEDRLARASVEVGILAGDRVSVSGVEAGARVVLSDPSPPILGSPLAPVEDEAGVPRDATPADPDAVAAVRS